MFCGKRAPKKKSKEKLNQRAPNARDEAYLFLTFQFCQDVR
jgi:hypothetical protein